jgi:hypothetical protein
MNSREWMRGYRAGLVAAIRIALGNKCARCGSTDFRTLDTDHIAGGGTRHRRTSGGGLSYLRSILSNIRTGQYRCLCANCHRIVGYHSRRSRA